MYAVKAIYDGCNIKPIQPIKIQNATEVLIVFPEKVNKYSPEQARKLLRGAGKGENLTKTLLQSRHTCS
jgi:hypothetical protein